MVDSKCFEIINSTTLLIRQPTSSLKLLIYFYTAFKNFLAASLTVINRDLRGKISTNQSNLVACGFVKIETRA